MPENEKVSLTSPYALVEILHQSMKNLRPCLCLVVKSAVVKEVMFFTGIRGRGRKSSKGK